MSMQVAFYKVDNGRLCAWVAAPPKRKRFQGTTMASGRDLPHDLAQFVVEDVLGLRHGFWGLLANGATFKSVAGRRRTQPGRQLIQVHRAALNATEHIVNAHVTAWRMGASTPAAPALDAIYARWKALPVGEELSLDWSIHRIGRVTRSRHQSVSLGSPRRENAQGRFVPHGSRAGEQRHSADGAPRRS
jgi:hypothetical protein